MIELNCMSGLKRKLVRVHVIGFVDVLAGGESDEDRVDAIVDMFDGEHDTLITSHMESLRPVESVDELLKAIAGKDD